MNAQDEYQPRVEIRVIFPKTIPYDVFTKESRKREFLAKKRKNKNKRH